MKKVRTSHKGRICKLRHCKHILSIYNHEEYCHIHLGLGQVDRTPRDKAVKA